jgi:actin-related protein
LLRRPVERGMVVNWELERAIWHQTFLSEKEAQVKVRLLESYYTKLLVP